MKEYLVIMKVKTELSEEDAVTSIESSLDEFNFSEVEVIKVEETK